MRPIAFAVTLVLVASCSTPLPVSGFASDGGTALDPVRFFTGHVASWGIMEDRGGQPSDIIRTDCTGVADGPDGLRMVQTLTIGHDAPTRREWRMKRLGNGRFEASANDMVGSTIGESSGRAFHWQWTLALKPGNALYDVAMDQWWYLQDDGSLLNRTTIRKFGIIAAEVTEHFVPKS